MYNTRGALLISGLRLSPDADVALAIKEARRRLRGVRLLSEGMQFSVYKKAVDARDRECVRLVYTVIARGNVPTTLPEGITGVSLLDEEEPVPVYGSAPLSAPPVVVGSGPAGLFCALLLAEHGYAPLLLERGGDVKERR